AEVLQVKLRKIKFPLPLAYLATVVSEIAGKISKNPMVFSRQKFDEMKQDAWVADTAKAGDLLSFHPGYSLAEGIKETIFWYRENGWL
ncbi:MAG: hypothetical protein JXB23_10610, partial [Candidatus Aminicenantes bacterium]|nr:hypothetical protein [Candidatus Aminicenantes bacterium]